jgi:hypothetical protein
VQASDVMMYFERPAHDSFLLLYVDTTPNLDSLQKLDFVVDVCRMFLNICSYQLSCEIEPEIPPLRGARFKSKHHSFRLIAFHSVSKCYLACVVKKASGEMKVIQRSVIAGLDFHQLTAKAAVNG